MEKELREKLNALYTSQKVLEQEVRELRKHLSDLPDALKQVAVNSKSIDVLEREHNRFEKRAWSVMIGITLSLFGVFTALVTKLFYH